MNIYTFKNYKEFVRAWVELRPNQGRGYYQKISQHLRMHRSSVSQVFQGSKQLSLEQASELSDFLTLGKDESAYFLTLVQRERAGSKNLEEKLDVLLKSLRKAAEVTTPKIEIENTLEELQQAHFYSNWYYSAIRTLCSIPGYQNVDAIAEYLKLDRKILGEAISFLKKAQLLVENKKGELSPGTLATYLPPDSPYANQHRRNWRLKAMEQFTNLENEEMAFSAPLSLSRKDFVAFKKRLSGLVEDLYILAQNSEPETMAIMNLDWVKF